MKLYTATIRGRKYYFSGDLTPEAIRASEQFCLNLEMNAPNAHHQTLFECLLKYIELDLEFEVVSINVEHIFRINY